MIQLNPRYEAIFNPDNIDHEGCGDSELIRLSAYGAQECESNDKSCLNIAEREQTRPKVNCDRIASLMSVGGIKEAMNAGLYKQAVTMYLQLLRSMTMTRLSPVIV